MENQLVTFETAKLAKEKGFEVKIIGTFNGNHYYNYKGELDGDQLEIIKSICNSKPNPLIANIAAPTQSLLQRWLREKHKINISMINGSNIINLYYYEINMFNKFPIKGDSSKYLTYEQALEEALLKALKLIKTK